MSSKKRAFVEKGLILAVFLVVGAVSYVVGQAAWTGTNNAEGLPSQISDQLSIVVNVARRAVLVAIQSEENADDGISTEFVLDMPRVDSVGMSTYYETDTAGWETRTWKSADSAWGAYGKIVVGNVGLIFVETNYHLWDVVALREREGKLVNTDQVESLEDLDMSIPGANTWGGGSDPVNAGDNGAFPGFDNVPGGWVENWGAGTTTPQNTGTHTYTDMGGGCYELAYRASAFADPVLSWECKGNRPKGGVPGYALMCSYDGGATVEACELEIGIGVIRYGVEDDNGEIWSYLAASGQRGNAATEGIHAVAKSMRNPEHVLVDTILTFDDEECASFAKHLGNKLKNNSGPGETDLSYFTGIPGGNIGSMDVERMGFPQISTGYELILDRLADTDYKYPLNQTTQEPTNIKDNTMVFFVNARLALDATNPAHRIAGNRNGEYKENLYFTFWGNF